MPYFISGVTADYHDLIARTPEEFRLKNGVEVLVRHRVLEIEPGEKRVKVVDLSSGREFYDEYTRLMIATGARAFVPPIDGIGLDGCFMLRKLDDSLRIKAFLEDRKPRKALVVGAGPIGLEMCESFRTAGLDVTLLEMTDQVMPLIDPDLAANVQAHLEHHGVDCLLGQRLEAIEGDSAGSVRRVSTSDVELECDLVLLGIGIRPVTQMAAAAGAELGIKGAIRVDGHLRTNLEDVYAAGDCATTTNTVTGQETWLPLGSTSRKQGRLAGENMFGGDLVFPGVQGTSVVKCFDLTIGRTGLSEAEAKDAGFEPAVTSVEADSLHKYYPGGAALTLKLCADRESGRLLGAQIVGGLSSVAEKRLDILAVAIGAQMTVEDLQYLDLAYAPPYSTAIDVPLIAGNVMTGDIRGRSCGCDPEGLE
jgi:NADPH-dependent 2,4-dienoyl-CoA reductase/sulfur reductase-like enzyme